MATPQPIAQMPVECWHVEAAAQCGFPSPADDHTQRRIDLNEILLHQPAATYYMRVRGTSMRDAGIEDGDCIIIDRSLEARHGDVILAVIDGEFTVKTLFKRNGKVSLKAANPLFPEITIREGQELSVWGVVTWVIKQASRRGGLR
jgi:DNA polymerase V